ncbi:MAG: protein phosphatase 2C domain-containing protein [Pseudomonadota bacterium]
MKDLLFANADTDGVHGIDQRGYRISLLCRPVGDAPNQDSAAVLRPAAGCVVLVVADGMGGGPAGDAASRLAIEAMSAAVQDALEQGLPLRTGILNGFEQAHDDVLSHIAGAATTLLAAELQQDMARLYQVGDSTALVFGQRGRLKQHTTSHSPVGYAVRSGILDEEAALTHEERHYVSNMVGIAPMSVEMGLPFRLARHDTLVLGSDGLFDNLSVDEVVECARTGAIDAGVARLAALARQRMFSQGEPDEPGKPDDLAIIGLRLAP